MTPSVSYLLFAYNHEEFIERSLRSALAQTQADLEIIVTDDGSRDATAAIIERMLAAYHGPHSVVFRRHETNRGLAAAINGAVAAARSDILVLAAGDDESLPDRSEVLARLFDDADVQLVFSNARIVDRHDVPGALNYREPPFERTLDSLAKPWTGLLGATVAIRRGLFDLFGPLDPALIFEDRVIPLRAAMAGKVAYVDRPLVRYRHHGGNIWAGVTESVATVKHWLAHRRRHNAMMIAVCENRLRDLATGLKLYPGRAAALNKAAFLARNHLDVATAENKLLGRAPLPARLSALRRVVAGKIEGGASLRTVLRKALARR